MIKASVSCAIVLSAASVLPLLAAESVKSARSGEEIYRAYCGNCHGSGWQGAPIAYDENEWKPRLKNGLPALLASAKQGVNSMPPMGACPDCTDEELKAALNEMLRF